jgi:ABC-type Fe3+/spermidine/putrescine transport system ATPase subunit
MLELRHVVKRFGDVAAVDDVSFAVRPGQIISLLGPSGCGKTTTLRLIAGFEIPDHGQIVIDGVDMRGRRPYERNVGLLFQDYALFPHMTVEQNIAYGPRYRGTDAKAIPGRVSELLALTRLTGLEKRRPGQLSGGQQQRVALARALATNPKLILLDEPLSALDAKLRLELRIELKEILSTVRATTIVVTHDQEEAMSLAEHVIVMHQGQIMQEGSPAEIYARPATKFVAEFVGRSNWFLGQFGGELGNGTLEFTSDDGTTLRLARPPAGIVGKVEVCVRPERIVLNCDGNNTAVTGRSDVNVLEGRIVSTALLGAFLHYVVQLSNGHRILLIDKNTGEPPKPEGKSVSIHFAAADCIVVPAESRSV